MKKPIFCSSLLLLLGLSAFANEDRLPSSPKLSDSVPGWPEFLTPGGVFAVDYVDYGKEFLRDDQFRLDRAVLRLDFQAGDRWTGRVAADLVGIDTRYALEEAWLAYAGSKALRLSMGLIRLPVGLEASWPAESSPFVGWGFPVYLNGRTDVGLRLESTALEGLLYVDLSGTAGLGFDAQGQDRSDPQLAARLMTHPFQAMGKAPLLPGLYVMTAVGYSSDYESELDVSHPLRGKLFDTGEIKADASQWFHYGVGLDAGPVHLALERVLMSLEDARLPDGTSRDFDKQITAFQFYGAWMLTGEHYDTRPAALRAQGSGPRIPSDREASWGSWELAGRYANGDIDRDLFTTGVTDYATSSQEFRTITGALNWYPSEDVRVSLEYIKTIADQTPRVLSGETRDSSWLLRSQWFF